MADCSATGTTIDRAAAAIIAQAAGNDGNVASAADAAKHVASLFGHAAATTLGPPVSSLDRVGKNGMAIQAVAPQSISVPMSTSVNASSSVHVPPQQSFVPQQHPIRHDQVHRHYSSPDTMMSAPGAMAFDMRYDRRQDPRQLHQHQQQQQHFMMMQQQQQHFMMQQQQQAMAMMIMRQQQQQQQQQMNQKNNMASESDLVQDDLHGGKVEEAVPSAFGHEGLVQGAGMEELAAAWAQAEAEYQDEYGRIAETESDVDRGVRGANMEQLAAAWAQAEAEYEDEYGQREFREVNKDDSHWASEVQSPYASLDDDHHHRHLAQYEFINVAESGVDTSSGNTSANFMEKGMEAFREGRLTESIRCFEMELQTQNRNNATAWKMLGKAHAESDQDQKAILCLEEAVKMDPYAPDSILALAVSYLNELNHERSLCCMKEFLTHNPKYAGVEEIMASIDGSGVSSSGEQHAFDEVKSMLLAALRYDPDDTAVLEALGVLYNVSKEYELASESFREALKTMQDEDDIYPLWNKLGATLANFGKSDEALGCYTNSLRIKPKFARAWLNMGISYSNLGEFDEASRCYLQTLALNQDATHCWTYLRMSLSSNERWDLLPYVFSRDLKSFQDHFDFVL